MKALFLRILRQLKNDPHTLALMLVAPFLIMSLIYLLLGDSDYRPVIAVGDMPEAFTEQLRVDADVVSIADLAQTDRYLIADSADAVIWQEGYELHIRTLENNSKSAAAIQDVQEAMSELLPAGKISISTI